MIESRRTFLKAAAAGVPLAIGAHPSGAATSEQAASVDAELRTPRGGEASIVCAGDWFLTRQVSAAVRPDTDAVFQLFRQADASFANLENGLSTVGSGELGGFRQGGPLRGDPALA